MMKKPLQMVAFAPEAKPHWTGSWREFLDGNAALFAPGGDLWGLAPALRRTLEAGQTFAIGGGAAPLFLLQELHAFVDARQPEGPC